MFLSIVESEISMSDWRIHVCLQSRLSTIGRIIARITIIIKIAITMKKVTTPPVDIFMTAVANRLLQSTELMGNELMGFLVGLSNG